MQEGGKERERERERETKKKKEREIERDVIVREHKSVQSVRVSFTTFMQYIFNLAIHDLGQQLIQVIPRITLNI